MNARTRMQDSAGCSAATTPTSPVELAVQSLWSSCSSTISEECAAGHVERGLSAASLPGQARWLRQQEEQGAVELEDEVLLAAAEMMSMRLRFCDILPPKSVLAALPDTPRAPWDDARQQHGARQRECDQRQKLVNFTITPAGRSRMVTLSRNLKEDQEVEDDASCPQTALASDLSNRLTGRAPEPKALVFPQPVTFVVNDPRHIIDFSLDSYAVTHTHIPTAQTLEQEVQQVVAGEESRFLKSALEHEEGRSAIERVDEEAVEETEEEGEKEGQDSNVESIFENLEIYDKDNGTALPEGGNPCQKEINAGWKVALSVFRSPDSSRRHTHIHTDASITKEGHRYIMPLHGQNLTISSEVEHFATVRHWASVCFWALANIKVETR